MDGWMDRYCRQIFSDVYVYMYVEIWDDIDILKDVKMIRFLAVSFATLEKVDLALCHHLGGAVDGQTSDVVWGPQFHPVGGVGSPKQTVKIQQPLH